MRRILRHYAALGVIVCAMQGVDAVAEVRTPLVVPAWTETAPDIDGKLDESLWKTEPIAAWLRPGGQPAAAVTRAWIGCDGEAFYAAFQCEAPSSAMAVENSEDHSPVWVDESVELFIVPWNAPDASSLYHFVVNASGAKTFLRAEEVKRIGTWDAAVDRTERGWSVEMRIPLDVFTEQGTNEAAWRVLFGRNSKALDESSSYPAVSGRFASFWDYARLLPPSGKKSFLRQRADLRPLDPPGGPGGHTAIRQVPEETSDKPLIIPQPVSAKFTRGRMPLSASTRILIAQGATHADARAAEVLVRWIEKKTGFRPDVQRVLSGEGVPTAGAIAIGEPWLNPISARLLDKSRDTLTAGDPGPEGYVVRVTPEWAIAAGSDQKGTFWAAQTLAQMIEGDSSGGWSLACGVVRDRPAMPFRSVHLLTAKDSFEFQSKLIEEILSPFKINYVILQMDKYAWESHPEVVDPDNHLTPANLRKLVAFAKDHHITYIPLVMSLGHMEWIFRDGAHLDIAEDPSVPYAYCPLNEKSYDLMEDLFDEAYTAFQKPPLFHIGHDEFDMRGDFPTHEECRKLGKVELYYRDTRRLAEYVRSLGARPMMWGDILLKPEFVERLGEIGREMIIADWHYTLAADYPSIDLFQKNGFDVIGCPWYSPENIYNFSRYAGDRDAMGMMQTTWSGWQTAEVVFQNWPEQMFQYVMGAEWVWSPGEPPLDEMTYEPDELFLQRWWPDGIPNGTGKMAEGQLFGIGLAPWANVSVRDTESHPGWLGLGPGLDLSGLRPGIRRLGRVSYRVLSSAGGRPSAIMLRGPDITSAFPTEVTGIEVGSEAKQLWFLHTAAYPDKPDRTVGEYVVRYADGSSETIPIVYAKNIVSWLDNRPALAYQAAWKGATADGRTARLRAFPWDNPHPEKVIASLDFRSAPESQAAPVLVAISGIRAN